MKAFTKPKQVEAYQFTRAMLEGKEELPDGVQVHHYPTHKPKDKVGTERLIGAHKVFVVRTPLGNQQLNVGDWIVVDDGVRTLYYPEHFAERFELENDQ